MVSESLSYTRGKNIMKKTSLKIVICAILVFTSGFTVSTIKAAESKSNDTQLAEIEKLIGIKFPADAKIIIKNKSNRYKGDQPVSVFYIIHSSTPVKFNMPEEMKGSPELFIKTIKTYTKKKDLGKLKDKWKYTYLGSSKKIAWWRASQAYFESGNYLTLQINYHFE